MSVVKRIIRDSIERLKVDELLADEYEQAGYGGITLTKTPLGAQINLYAMRPGRVIGRRGRAIKAASARLLSDQKSTRWLRSGQHTQTHQFRHLQRQPEVLQGAFVVIEPFPRCPLAKSSSQRATQSSLVSCLAVWQSACLRLQN